MYHYKVVETRWVSQSVMFCDNPNNYNSKEIKVYKKSQMSKKNIFQCRSSNLFLGIKFVLSLRPFTKPPHHITRGLTLQP